MHSAANDQLRLINAIRAEQIEQAAISRRFESPAPSIRRVIGTRIVRFGNRLAGEPTYSLVRSR
ncbi:MAG: hypothetical protein H0U52_16635 [Chloroflexi bacterium]|nr:hypothetical protein [Chloroflexota bacterium]